jgi:hypothetical protein
VGVRLRTSDLGLQTSDFGLQTSDATPDANLPQRRYNIRVPSPEIRVLPPEPQTDSPRAHHHAVYASEATGLLLIALVLLILTLVRYWHDIHWSLR